MSAKGIICISPPFKVGDPPPSGYTAWHEWARMQYRGGLRQRLDPLTFRWKCPQEFKERP